jgi:hypothetical protein
LSDEDRVAYERLLADLANAQTSALTRGESLGMDAATMLQAINACERQALELFGRRPRDGSELAGAMECLGQIGGTTGVLPSVPSQAQREPPRPAGFAPATVAPAAGADPGAALAPQPTATPTTTVSSAGPAATATATLVIRFPSGSSSEELPPPAPTRVILPTAAPTGPGRGR